MAVGLGQKLLKQKVRVQTYAMFFVFFLFLLKFVEQLAGQPDPEALGKEAKFFLITFLIIQFSKKISTRLRDVWQLAGLNPSTNQFFIISSVFNLLHIFCTNNLVCLIFVKSV